jgi:hypothetical protein
MEIDDCIDFLYMSYFVAIHKSNHNKHYIFSTVYVYIVMTMMDPFEPILNLCTITMFHFHGKKLI